jgi:BirA family transcriptional regulator, biotin operon repressor / biotin---[acetyl-CoA-carboxylase] ligase
MKKADKNTIILQEVESSNNYAKQLLVAGKACHGTVVLAYYQNNGRGYGRNQWESEAKKNLLTSVVLFPEFLPADKQFYLSKITSLALVDLLNEEIGSVSIKWPNDIYAGDKKIAGILIENSVGGNYLQSSVIGIGLNINQERFSSNLPNPVSLKQITNKEFSIESVAERLQVIFRGWYRQLKNGQTTAIDYAYFCKLYRLNQWARFKKGELIFEARIRGIGEFGQFIIEDRTGNVSEYLFKEIEFVI